MLETMINYLNQASTWRGVFGVLGAFGVVIVPEMSNAIIAFALGAIGLVNVCRNENKAN